MWSLLSAAWFWKTKYIYFLVQQVLVNVKSRNLGYADWQEAHRMIFSVSHTGSIIYHPLFLGFLLMVFLPCSCPHFTGYRCQPHERAVWVSPASQVPNTSAGGEKWRTKAGIEIGPGGSNLQFQSSCQSQRKGMSRLCFVKIKRWCCELTMTDNHWQMFIKSWYISFSVYSFFGYIPSFGKKTKQCCSPCQVFLPTH